MNWESVKGNWHELKGLAKSRWAKLSDDDLMAVAGDRERLVGKLQRHYGLTREEAEREIDAFRWK